MLIHKLSIVLLLVLPFTVFSQWKTKDSAQFQKELDVWYTNAETSPLAEELRREILGLNYFPISDDYVVSAQFIPSKKVKTKQYGTSSGSKRAYNIVGKLKFELKGNLYELSVLKSATTTPNDEYEDYLTVPFLDETNGESSYGAGRYIGIWKEDIQNGEVILNFNRAYHPTCAYVGGYSCLIPPRKNFLPLAVEAGVKLGFKK